MTVSYQYDVASSTSGGFIRLLFRWRGSIWKLVYLEMFFFTAAYFTLTMMYRFLFNEWQRGIFEKMVFLCSTFMDLIPLSFVLGFYVSFIATRWWNQYIAIPWPDKLMNSIALYVPGADETSRVLRRTLMRYLNVALILVLRSISMAVKRRFPTRDHLVEAGFLTKLELEMLNSVPSHEFNTFWIPCTWFINLLRESKQECRITDSNGLKLIMEEFNEFRSKCGLLWSYDWISIPLVYTQVVTLATYAFFGACIFGRQYIEVPDKPDHNFEFYIPIFTIFQLFFYMGLLKVAEQLINPFGDDDEDFELNWIIDRHMKVSYLGVDLLNTNPPPLIRDNYFYQQDMKLPYTEASLGYKKKTYRGSVATMKIPQEKQNLLVPEFDEDDDEDKIAATYGMGNRGASLWTLVGGKLNTRFSVSNQNLDTVTLESGSNNWKVSNPSLFAPLDGLISENKQTGSLLENQLLQIPEDTVPEEEQIQPGQSQPNLAKLNQRRSSDIPKRALKNVVKKVVPKMGHKPQLRRRAYGAHNRWVSFHSPKGKEEGNEVLSLYRGAGEPEPPEHLRTTSDIRRLSFGDLNASEFDNTSSRFQSLPDVKQYAVERGVAIDDDLENDYLPEDQDNLSTANLLVLPDGDYDGESDLVIRPRLTFTRASISRQSSLDSLTDQVERKLSTQSVFEQDETEDKSKTER
ncbi:bestrophin-4-like isoform X1 [Parasteatoda tepidariorum]|uniref:bestrophin-4-like isoform X1 n=2 Tax=Parasteatoda tepidariorum TaxID=114398 RepID=UPI00077FB9F5|nr:bestrophin-4-like isoform X1 [Parasteatoda tepidariorum]